MKPLKQRRIIFRKSERQIMDRVHVLRRCLWQNNKKRIEYEIELEQLENKMRISLKMRGKDYDEHKAMEKLRTDAIIKNKGLN